MTEPLTETAKPPDRPSPGSDEAIDLGCTCPVLDNGRGRRSDGLFWFSAGCTVHDKEGARRPEEPSMPVMPTDKSVTRFSLRLCPHCGYVFDAAGSLAGRIKAPEPGDVGVCINCAEIMVFEAGTAVRKPTPKEQAAYADESDNEWEELRRARAGLRYLQRRGHQTKQAKRGLGRRN